MFLFCMVGALLSAYVFLVFLPGPVAWIMFLFIRQLTFLKVG